MDSETIATDNISSNTNSSKPELENNDLIEVSKVDPEKEKVKSIIEEITDIINKSRSENKSEEETSIVLADYLKEKKYNILKILDKSGGTLAHKYCNEKENFHLKSFLLSLEKVLDQNELNTYLLHEDITRMNIFEGASENGYQEIFEILAKYLQGNQALLEKLVREGKSNIFHKATESNKIISLLFFYEFYNNPKILNKKNGVKWTPLHLACYRGHYEFSKFLVNLGADYNELDRDKKTPLFYAVEGNFARISKLLVLNGVNKNQRDVKNKIALDYCKDKMIYEILKDKNFIDTSILCKTNYESLKGHYNHIVLISLFLSMMLIHLIVFTLFNLGDYSSKCIGATENFSFEGFLMIVDILFEFIGVVTYFLFQLSVKMKNKVKVNNENPDIQQPLYILYSLNENLCPRCRRMKTDKTQHCIACNKCIDEWDHHCFWLNTCINSSNQKYFNLFLFQLLTVIVANLFTSLLFIFDVGKFPKIYYGFLGKIDTCPVESFSWVSYIVLFACIVYFITAISFLVGSLLPFLVDLFTEKKVIEQTASSADINAIGVKGLLLNSNEGTDLVN